MDNKTLTDKVKKGSLPIMAGTAHTVKEDFSGGFSGQVSCFVQEIDPETGILGEKKLHHYKPNLIVNGARYVLAKLLIEDPNDVTLYNNSRITKMKFGTDGQSGGDPLVPVAPTVSDTGLNTETLTLDMQDTVNQPDPYWGFEPMGDESSVRFTAIMGTTVGNGAGTVTYTEAGLFTKDDVMFARETFPSLVKNSSRVITFEWLILF